MRKSGFFKNCGIIVAAAMAAAAIISCEKEATKPNEEDNNVVTPPATEENNPAADEIIGIWGAVADKFELDYGKSALYQMTEDGSDYAFDEDGNYITVTIEEYINKWCEDYNSDPQNEGYIAKPEDLVFNEYELNQGVISFGTFNVTADEITFNQGMKGTYYFDLLQIKGTYRYDSEKGTLNVHNVAIKDDPAELAVHVRKDDEGNMTFTYTDMYLYALRTYDQTVEYTAFTPVSYICRKGEIPAPSASATAAKTYATPPLSRSISSSATRQVK